MLSSFRIQNFKSILEETVSFKFGEKKAPNGYENLETIPFLKAPKGKRIIPCLMLFGANGSGKSNLLEALSVFQLIVQNGINYARSVRDEKGVFLPNKLNAMFRTTSFELDFFVSDNKYNFYLEYDRHQIKTETLKVNDKLLYEINDKKNNFKKLEIKGYSKKDFQNLLEVECSYKKGDVWLQQHTFLSKVNNRYPGLNEHVTRALVFFYVNLKISLVKDSDHIAWSPYDRVFNILDPYQSIIDEMNYDSISDESIEKDAEDKLHRLKTAASLLKKLDINLGEFALRNDDNKSIIIKHVDVNGKNIDFDFEEESYGTQTLTGLILEILHVLDTGKVLVVDELDRSLHPILLRKVVRLFKDKRYNKKNAQIIFTTHTTDLLEDEAFRVSEVGIINNTLKTGTKMTRLSDFEGLRNVNDFRKRYLEGRFSGIPFSYI